MDRYRSYRGRSGGPRRRRSYAPAGNAAQKRTVKLVVCVVLFVAAAFMKFAFPSALQAVGDKLNTVVNYKAALETLGEGFSGQKKFTAALGEAFTYAFTGTPSATAAPPEASAAKTAPTQTGASTAAANGTADKTAANASGDTAVQTFSQDIPAAPQVGASPAAASKPSAAPSVKPSAAPGAASASPQTPDKAFSNAVVAAFLQRQEQYSDYAIPAGASYGMPELGFSVASPVKGVVSSPFGYRLHPTEKTVKFHYGTDIAASTGTTVSAFADGKVLAAGKSSSLGNYVVLSHAGVESEYAHCDKLLVKSGQAVKKGEKIATVGKTGNATDSCLHFELRVNGVCVNPEFYIKWT